MFVGYKNNIKFDGWTVENHLINNSMNLCDRFSAVTYKKGDNLVIAFKGTDFGVFIENKWYLFTFNTHPQSKFAFFIDTIANLNLVDENVKIYLTDHSLGGYLAIYAFRYMLNYSSIKYKIINVKVFCP